MFRKIISGILAISLSVFTLSCDNGEGNLSTSEMISRPEVNGEMQVVSFKVGKADSYLISTPNKNIMIDTGEDDDGKSIVKYLKKNGISTIDMLIITHFHQDHVGGADRIIGDEEITVKEVVQSNYDKYDYDEDDKDYMEYLDALSEKNITPLKLSAKESREYDGLLMNLYPSEKTFYGNDDENNLSIVVDAYYGETSFLFPADAEQIRLQELLKLDIKDIDFLKVPHHGSYNGATNKFLETVKPKFCIIPDSEKNPADSNTVKKLEALGCEVYHSYDGDLICTSDGKDIVIKQ